MALTIDGNRRKKLATKLQSFFREHFDEELSEFRATQLIDFFLENLGPEVYNQAVQDARRFMLEKLEDLEGEVYHPEGT